MIEILFIFICSVFLFIYINLRKIKTNADLVKEFTEQSMEIQLPDRAQEMTNEEVKKVLKFVLSEVLEVLCVVSDDPESELVELIEGVEKPKQEIRGLHLYDTPHARNTAIADGFVDMMYYMYNASCKAGINLDKVFKEVHRANMSKRFPDGRFHRNENGKVIKPPTFIEANVSDVMTRQMAYGGF